VNCQLWIVGGRSTAGFSVAPGQQNRRWSILDEIDLPQRSVSARNKPAPSGKNARVLKRLPDMGDMSGNLQGGNLTRFWAWGGQANQMIWFDTFYQ